MTKDISDQDREAGRGYEALFVPALFETWCAPVLSGLEPGGGGKLLDVGCGTGVLTRAAADQFGADNVTGIDPAPGMLAAARETASSITWVQGAAEALPFEDAGFDHVVSQFALMFVSDRAKAMSEMHRVLRSGGGLSIAVWGPIEVNPAYREVSALLDDLVSQEAGNAVRIPFCLGDAGEFAALAETAEFRDVAVETQVGKGRFPSVKTVVEAELRGWLPLFGIHLDEKKIGEVLSAAETRLSALSGHDGAAEFQTCAHLLTARK